MELLFHRVPVLPKIFLKKSLNFTPKMVMKNSPARAARHVVMAKWRSNSGTGRSPPPLKSDEKMAADVFTPKLKMSVGDDDCKILVIRTPQSEIMLSCSKEVGLSVGAILVAFLVARLVAAISRRPKE